MASGDVFADDPLPHELQRCIELRDKVTNLLEIELESLAAAGSIGINRLHSAADHLRLAVGELGELKSHLERQRRGA